MLSSYIENYPAQQQTIFGKREVTEDQLFSLIG